MLGVVVVDEAGDCDAGGVYGMPQIDVEEGKRPKVGSREVKLLRALQELINSRLLLVKVSVQFEG